jgi:glucose/mannose-6-phosphate isomerase
MFGLDGPEALAGDGFGLTRGVGDSLAAFDEARAAAEAVEMVWPADEVDDVAICGMGGSAIAADLVTGAYRERLRRPVATLRDYFLPGWVDDRTLVILSSYSGNTEETLTAASQALERASLCVGVSSGGKLVKFYGPEGVPIVPVRPGLQPRAALLRMMVPLLVILERMEVLPPLGADMEEARATIRRSVETLGPDVPESQNPAKQLARALQNSVPLIWGGELTAPVAVRWKGQLNENAKIPAYASALPELDHNEIVGFAGMPPELSSLVTLVLLRDPRNHPQVIRRFDLTRELVEMHVSSVLSVEAEGQSPLAKMIDLVMLGDYVSLYLALLRAVDPGPVEIIERLKGRLAEQGYGRTADPGV